MYRKGEHLCIIRVSFISILSNCNGVSCVVMCHKGMS